MENRQTILSELQEISPALAKMPTQMPYAVPENYFENLASQILSQIDQTQTNASVPEGYFDSLPQLLLQKVRGLEVTNELQNLAPIINSISKKPPHFVPDNYFETLTPKGFESTPVINISAKKTWKRWAVAAAIGAITILTTSLFLQKTNNGNTLVITIENATDTLSGASELSAALSQINDKELAGYAAELQSSVDVQQSLFYLNTTDNFEKALKDFSETELQEQIMFYPVDKKNS